MDAVEFMKEWQRMCKTFEVCEDCVGAKYCYNFNDFCPENSNNWHNLVPVVEKWSKEHPRKTRLQDFIEKFPSALLVDGIPERFCPYDFGYKVEECFGDDDCEKCWNQPIE